MAGSFSGISFWVDGENMTPREVTAEVNIRHIPGSNNNYIDLGGRNVQSLSLTLFFHSTSEFNSLAALVGTPGTLSYFGGTFQAILDGISQTKMFPAGQQYADAKFTLL